MADYKKVLLVDDNQLDLYIGEKIIKKFEFAEEVIAVQSAIDALDYLTNNIENPDAIPDVIFLDINMPELSGFDFMDKYENLPDSIKQKSIVTMLSTSLNENDRMRAEGNQYIKGFINKPLNEEKIKEFKLFVK